jgi:hypothetical protein
MLSPIAAEFGWTVVVKVVLWVEVVDENRELDIIVVEIRVAVLDEKDEEVLPVLLVFLVLLVLLFVVVVVVIEIFKRSKHSRLGSTLIPLFSCSKVSNVLQFSRKQIPCI